MDEKWSADGIFRNLSNQLGFLSCSVLLNCFFKDSSTVVRTRQATGISQSSSDMIPPSVQIHWIFW